MWKKFAILPALVVLLLAVSASGQELTERHIPVGAYPSLAGKYVTAGTIVSVNEENRTLILEHDGGERSFRVTVDTKIWLDRSLRDQTTLDGSFDDLATGVRAEVRTLGPDQPNLAYWVKLQLPASP